MWKYKGQIRPPFAEEPGPGQESVWDYPRPPSVVEDGRKVEVKIGSFLLASTRNAFRVLETASPPTFYLPPEDVDKVRLISISGSSFCEWKGAASYWALKERANRQAIGWSYEEPSASFAKIAGYFSFYPALVECYVDGEQVRPQPGRFYGGWVTDELAGPFKGAPGTGHW